MINDIADEVTINPVFRSSIKLFQFVTLCVVVVDDDVRCSNLHTFYGLSSSHTHTHTHTHMPDVIGLQWFNMLPSILFYYPMNIMLGMPITIHNTHRAVKPF